MMPKKLLPIDTIVAEYRAGESLRQLGNRHGVSAETIRARLVEVGVEIRDMRSAVGQPMSRARVASTRVGRPAWNAGLSATTDERVRSYAETLVGRAVSSETRAKLKAARSKYPWFSTCQECGRSKGYNRSSRCTSCAAKWRAATYPNPMAGRTLSDAHRRAIMSAQGWGKMSGPERTMQRVLGQVFSPFEVYRYTGSGGTVVRFACGRLKVPDFTHTHDRKVIEVFGRYWHRNDDPSELIRAYKDAGWDCLVLWEDEVDTFGVRDRVMEFTYPYEYEEELRLTNRV